MDKNVVFNNNKACACLEAVGKVHSVVTCVIHDRYGLTWEPDKVDGNNYQLQVLPGPMVTCQICGVPWILDIEIRDRKGDTHQ